MKRRTKPIGRLQLNKETVRNLTDNHLEEVAGGQITSRRECSVWDCSTFLDSRCETCPGN